MSFLSGMLNSWGLRDSYMDWLRSLEASSESADKNGMTTCNKCGFCCARRPCMPTPDELKIIAGYLNLEVKDAVKKYFVGDRLGGSSTKFIFPAKETQTDITGTFIDADRTFDTGHCILYDQEERKCTIHAVRPQNAKITNCWEPYNEELHELETKERNSLWDEVDLEDFGIEDNGGDDY